MALEPFFSLTPNTPNGNTYDPANPSAPYATGILNCYGVVIGWGTWSLASQSANNEALLGYSATGLTDQTISNTVNDLYGRSSLRIWFTGQNVSTENQYLLLFALRGVQGSPTAQFFVNGALVDTEELSGNEQVAVLLDCPGSGVRTTVHVRLASASYWAIMGFKGVDCYLL